MMKKNNGVQKGVTCNTTFPHTETHRTYSGSLHRQITEYQLMAIIYYQRELNFGMFLFLMGASFKNHSLQLVISELLRLLPHQRISDPHQIRYELSNLLIDASKANDLYEMPIFLLYPYVHRGKRCKIRAANYMQTKAPIGRKFDMQVCFSTM